MIIGIAVGCSFLVLLLVGLGIYAVQQKKRAERAIGMSRPFGNSYSQLKKHNGHCVKILGFDLAA